MYEQDGCVMGLSCVRLLIFASPNLCIQEAYLTKQLARALPLLQVEKEQNGYYRYNDQLYPS